MHHVQGLPRTTRSLQTRPALLQLRRGGPSKERLHGTAQAQQQEQARELGACHSRVQHGTHHGRQQHTIRVEEVRPIGTRECCIHTCSTPTRAWSRRTCRLHSGKQCGSRTILRQSASHGQHHVSGAHLRRRGTTSSGCSGHPRHRRSRTRQTTTFSVPLPLSDWPFPNLSSSSRHGVGGVPLCT